jgi:hypothetical protein
MACSPARADNPIENRYLIPIWYTGQVEPGPEGRQRQVKARLQLNLAPMRNARVWLEPSKGLEVVAASVRTTTSTTAGAPSRDARFEGDLPAGSRCTFDAVVRARPGLGHGYVTLAFDYDFPVEELASYVHQHQGELYPDERLRGLLLKTLKKTHSGRQSGGVTRRIEFPTGGSK